MSERQSKYDRFIWKPGDLRLVKLTVKVYRDGDLFKVSGVEPEPVEWQTLAGALAYADIKAKGKYDVTPAIREFLRWRELKREQMK